jgi:hypothetical protein
LFLELIHSLVGASSLPKKAAPPTHKQAKARKSERIAISKKEHVCLGQQHSHSLQNTTPGSRFLFSIHIYIPKEEDVGKNDDEAFDGIHALSSGRFFLLFCFQRRSTHRFQRVVCVVPVNFFALFFGA